MSSLFLRLATVASLSLALAACSSDDGDPPPAPETLFDTLPAASPNKLRGVWETTLTQPSGTIEFRLRFIDKYVVGAAKCTVSGGSGIAPVIAGRSIALDTIALDAATGQLTIGKLVVEKTEANVICRVELPGNTYSFTVEDKKLTLTAAGGIVPAFTKIGD